MPSINDAMAVSRNQAYFGLSATCGCRSAKLLTTERSALAPFGTRPELGTFTAIREAVATRYAERR